MVDAVRTLAEARGATMAQVALAWLGGRPAVTSVNLGCRSLDQLADNLRAADLVLDDSEIAALDTASDPAPGDYPYGAPGLSLQSRELRPAAG